MKVLFLDQFGELGGGQQCLLDLLPAVLDAGWRATVCAPAGPLGDRVQQLGAATAPLALGAYASGAKPLAQKLRFGWDSLRAYRTIAALADELRPDLLYANGPRVLPAAAALAGRRGLPLIFHCHNRLTDAGSIRLCRHALRHGRARLIACCRFASADLREAVEPDRRHLVYNGVRGPSPSRPRHPAEHPTVGVLGRIGPEKGQAEFLEAVRVVARERPGCRFAICGAPLFDDPTAQRYLADLERSAAGLPVELLGWREDVHDVLAGWDALAVPSIREPATTRVILEAFACGVPVVAFATGGIPEVVEHGRTGLLIDPPRPDPLAAAIIELLDSRELARRLAGNGRAEWARRFSLERYQSEILAIMERTVHAGAPR